MKTLLIVDPQIDFISGSLAVAEGADAMNRLVDYLHEHETEIDHVVVTLDQHPIHHCSFSSEGGIWPAHCVRYTVGAAVYPPLMQKLTEMSPRLQSLRFVEKAITPERDAYSAFAEAVPEVLLQSDIIRVAGIAGDYCVKASMEDLTRHGLGDKLCPIRECIAYIHPPETQSTI